VTSLDVAFRLNRGAKTAPHLRTPLPPRRTRSSAFAAAAAVLVSKTMRASLRSTRQLVLPLRMRGPQKSAGPNSSDLKSAGTPSSGFHSAGAKSADAKSSRLNSSTVRVTAASSGDRRCARREARGAFFGVRG
jgi:hypothetical protein